MGGVAGKEGRKEEGQGGNVAGSNEQKPIHSFSSRSNATPSIATRLRKRLAQRGGRCIVRKSGLERMQLEVGDGCGCGTASVPCPQGCATRIIQLQFVSPTVREVKNPSHTVRAAA